MYPVELFVARNVLYAAKQGGGAIANWGEIDLLVTGGVALFDENNGLIVAATTTANLKQVSQFRIAINDGNGVRISAPIDRAAFNQSKHGTLAAAKQVVSVGTDSSVAGSMNYPTLAAGQIAELVITDRTDGDYRVGQVSRYYADVSVGSTAATVTAALIAAVNADVDAIVTATVIGANVGILLTAKEFGTTFQVGVAEIAANATIVADGTGDSVLVEYGKGTVAQLTELQNESDILLGKSASAGQQQYWWDRIDDVVASGITAFEMWVFQHATESRVGGKVQSVATVDTVLAYPTGTTPTTGLEAVLGGILGVVGTGPEAGSGSNPVVDN